MPNDHYILISAQVPFKTVQRIDKLAQEYGLSRANTIVKLLEHAAKIHGEPIQTSSTTPNGERRKDGVSITINNELRKIL